jgi:hypothetical protein
LDVYGATIHNFTTKVWDFMLKLDKMAGFLPEFSILGESGQTRWKYVVFRQGE